MSRFLMPKVYGLSGGLANLGLIVILPIFIVYHMLHALGVISLRIDGIFSGTALSTAALILAIGGWKPLLRGCIAHPTTLIAVSFFFYCIAWIAAHWLFDSQWYTEAACLQALHSVTVAVALFVIGFYAKWESLNRFFIVYLFLLLLAQSAYVIATGEIAFYGLFSDGVATYQEYARGTLVMLCLVIAYARNEGSTLAWFALGVSIVFLLGARSEMVAFLVVSLIAVLLAWYAKPARVGVVVIIGAIAIAFVMSIARLDMLTNPDQSRQIFSLATDLSWLARQDAAQVALEQIRDNPVLGKFGGHIDAFGSTGMYAHNVLSAWVAFGIVGFALYFANCIGSISVSLRRTLADQSGGWKFALFLSFGTGILLIGAKSVFEPLPALAWGLVAGMRLRHESSPANPVGREACAS